MSWAAFFQNLGRNALAIIPNSQPERPFSTSENDPGKNLTLVLMNDCFH